MTTTYRDNGVFDVDQVDLTTMRPVAEIIMDGGRNPGIRVYANGDGFLPRFFVETPGLDVIVGASTIRNALKLALRNGGWG
jgi:hypothetical protein